MPLPKSYVEGIDLQKRDFEHYNEKSYLNGVWSDHGWWYYYLEALALKVPLGTWLLLLFAAHAASGGRRRGRPPHRPRNPSFSPSAGDGSPRTGSRAAGACSKLSRSGEGNVEGASRPAAGWRDEFTLLFPALVILAFVSCQTGFNEHMRYVLPIFPFFFIWIGRVAVASAAGNE